RENAARRVLRETWARLPDPNAVPVATAAADRLDPTRSHPSPADRVWLPLDATGAGRIHLHELSTVWPSPTPPPPDPQGSREHPQPGRARRYPARAAGALPAGRRGLPRPGLVGPGRDRENRNRPRPLQPAWCALGRELRRRRRTHAVRAGHLSGRPVAAPP